MYRLKKILFFWLLPVFWMGLVFFFSSFHKLQVSPVGWQDFVSRKTAHFLEYAILCFLYFRSFKNTTRLSLPKTLIFSFLATVFYALTDEFHQTFVSGRTGRFFDIGVDLLGALFGTFFSWKISPFLPQKLKFCFPKGKIL